MKLTYDWPTECTIPVLTFAIGFWCLVGNPWYQSWGVFWAYNLAIVLLCIRSPAPSP